jgi:hypothetical protein
VVQPPEYGPSVDPPVLAEPVWDPRPDLAGPGRGPGREPDLVGPGWDPSAAVRSPADRYATRRGPSRTVWLTAVLLVLACAAGFGAAVVLRPPGGFAWQRGAPRSPGTSATSGAGLTASEVTGIRQLLDRRAKAVRGRDRAAFLADVDHADQGFLHDQTVEYDNLVTLRLADFRLTLDPETGFDQLLVPFAARAGNPQHAHAPGVRLQYRIAGLDDRDVAVPWVPIVNRSGGRWLVAGEVRAGAAGVSGREVTTPDLPQEAGGEAWQGDRITVIRTTDLVIVVSAGDRGSATKLRELAEPALDRVRAVRRGGWPGKVLVVAVRDRAVFDAYFAQSTDRATTVAAITVPSYADVVAWQSRGGRPAYVASRVIFNAKTLAQDASVVAHDLTHEFTHVAMGAVTGPNTPLWLVEGFAEYVAYKTEQVDPAAVRRSLRGTSTRSGLPADDHFYADWRNYLLSWLACRYAAAHNGEAKLVQLYAAFHTAAGPVAATELEQVMHPLFGMSLAEFTAGWQAYVSGFGAGD